MIEGWIKLYRQSIQSRVFNNSDLWKVWTWCLMKANREEKWVPVQTGKGNTEILVKPGQFIFGRKTASLELNMKESSIRNRMEKLKSMQNLDIQPDTHHSIITIINWDTYQGELEKEDRQKDNQRTGTGQPEDTNKKDKKDKKNILSSEVLDFFNSSLGKRYLEHRKNKKAPIGEKSYQHFFDQFKKWEKEGFSFEFVINTVIDRGWTGFNPDWIKNKPIINKPNFGQCPQCKRPNIDLTEDGICLECNRNKYDNI